MDGPAITTKALLQTVGQEVGRSHWHRIDQAMIDAFADLTKDHQFIHVDPQRAAVSPFGTTVAHGFLTLSLLSVMAEEALPPLADLLHSVNYGFDRVRFIAPVPVDSDVQAILRLKEMDTTRPGQVKLGWTVTVAMRGCDKPAIAAEWLHLHYIGKP